MGMHPEPSRLGNRELSPLFPWGEPTTQTQPPSRTAIGRVIPWGEPADCVGRTGATRGYPVGRTDQTTNKNQLAFY